MNWDQIENSWTAMTRRVRPDRTGFAISEVRRPSTDIAPADLDPRAPDPAELETLTHSQNRTT